MRVTAPGAGVVRAAATTTHCGVSLLLRDERGLRPADGRLHEAHLLVLHRPSAQVSSDGEHRVLMGVVQGCEGGWVRR